MNSNDRKGLAHEVTRLSVCPWFLRFNCAIEDLYDFNYEDAELPSHAAAVQIGYSNGSIGGGRNEHGLIYRHRITIEHVYSYPFDHTVIPAPPGP